MRGALTQRAFDWLARCNRCGYAAAMEKTRVIHTGGMGLLWCAGWLFTIGYLKLSFWPAALAILIWPYHIGVAVAALHH